MSFSKLSRSGILASLLLASLLLASLLLASLLLAPSLQASPPVATAQSSVEDAITHQVTRYLESSLKHFLQGYPEASTALSVRPLTRLPDHCQQTLVISRRSEHRPPIGTVRLSVECPGQWRQFVAVDVDVQVPAVHVSKALSRGDVITADVVQLLRVPWGKLRGQFFQKPAAVSGRQLKRSLAVGSLVEESVLVPDYLVQKGQVVTIMAGNGSLYVAMAGIALESGLLSETIRVRNRSSGQIVDARVIAKNRVQAGP